jgi:hypothetical protein
MHESSDRSYRARLYAIRFKNGGFESRSGHIDVIPSTFVPAYEWFPDVRSLDLHVDIREFFSPAYRQFPVKLTHYPCLQYA